MCKILTFVLRYADRQDCTNGGITSKHSMLTMFYNCEREDALKECELKNINPNECLLLVKREIFGGRSWYAEPLVKGKGLQMFGGNFVYTSDSSFPKEYHSHRPIPVHDRYESQEEYNEMCI